MIIQVLRNLVCAYIKTLTLNHFSCLLIQHQIFNYDAEIIQSLKRHYQHGFLLASCKATRLEQD